MSFWSSESNAKLVRALPSRDKSAKITKHELSCKLREESSLLVIPRCRR